METKAVMVCALLVLALPLATASQTVTVKTTAGLLIEGEVQGMIVAKAERTSGELEYAVLKGQDIRSIDESGIVAVSVARNTFRRIPRSEPGGDLPLPADAVLAWIILVTDSWTQPTGAIRLAILGELQGPNDGITATAARILPSVRIRTPKGEVTVPVTQLPRPN
ncbi:MAG: hypothetical protein NTV04_19060 [Deltaproteobacteria bacterium]|jgi:hypothetical protein|nr:hypothetical protein [Deltaproteobacteria bacterium]